VTIVERTWRWCRRHPVHTALSAVSILAFLALAMAAVSHRYNSQLEGVNAKLELTAGELKTAIGELRLEKHATELERDRVRKAEATVRRYFYASQMVQVEQARQQNQPERVVQLLRSVIPDEPDQEDPRGFEWYHLWRQYHGEDSRL